MLPADWDNIEYFYEKFDEDGNKTHGTIFTNCRKHPTKAWMRICDLLLGYIPNYKDFGLT